MSLPDVPNTGAENVSFYTPAQVPPAGAALNADAPTLFTPIKIRGVEFQNRIFLSPLCQYSSKDGFPSSWHMSHIGGIASRGPGLSMMEATSVVSEGRITPQDAGIWSDEFIDAYRPIVEFAHSQNQKIGIQLGHAGRKASTVAPWLGSHVATENVGGWPDNVYAPSSIQFDSGYPVPKEMTIPEIKEVVEAFKDAAVRAVKAGYDVIELHGAHGYLGHSFMSPFSNKRTDQYGGSFENRIRFLLEIIDVVRAVIPDTMPLFLRVSATDRIEETLPNEPSWRIEDTVKLAHIVAEHGVDLLDVSSGGNAKQQSLKGSREPAYQSQFSEAVKKSVGDKLLVGSVGNINTGKIAQGLLDDGRADVVFSGRWFQKNPGLAWAFAEELGVTIALGNQMEWPFRGRDFRQKKLTFWKERL